MGWIGCVRCEKFQCDLMAQTYPLIAPSSVLQRNIAKCNGTLQNAPEHEFGSNGVDRVRSLRKFQCDFMAQTCALIAPVQPVLHRVSCSNETLPNAPKHYEML